jgi:hypothetical protein
MLGQVNLYARHRQNGGIKTKTRTNKKTSKAL